MTGPAFGTLRPGAQRANDAAATERKRLAAVDDIDAIDVDAIDADAIDAVDDQRPTDDVLRSVVSVRLSDVDPERVRWLWSGRLPLGKLVMLDGDPSVGKSTIAVDLAARVSTGSPMPDGSRLDGPGAVVLLSAEDGAGDTIRPRLDAAGGNAERVHLFTDVIEVDDEGRTRRRPPALPRDVDRLEALVRHSGAALVVVDVLAAYLGGTDSHRDTDVRSVLHPLAAMADRTSCVVVCLRHLSKSGGPNPLYRGGGSIAFIGAARAAMLAAVDPEDEGRRVLAVSKCNLAPIGPSLAYRLVDSPEHGCARVAWEGVTTHRASDLLAPTDDDSLDAAAVLRQLLDDGPMWVKDAVDAMAVAGFSKDQAKRAKAKAGVRSCKVGKPGDAESGWQWGLPQREQDTPQGSEGSGRAPLLPSLPSGPQDDDDGPGPRPAVVA